MPSNLLNSKGCVLVTSGTRATGTFTSGAIRLPKGESYLFILDITAVSGTSPTLDVAIQVTHDDGTTFTTVLRFAQASTVSRRLLRIQPTLGRGEAGTEGASADTGGALNANVPFSRKIQIKATTAGSSAGLTWSLNCIIVPKQSGTY